MVVWGLWHLNSCMLFNDKFCLYICIGWLVEFYGVKRCIFFFLLDVFKMIAIALVSVINHYHIYELHLFWDTLYNVMLTYT